MDIETYSRLALRTAGDLGPTGDLIHAALLITSEAGEVADAIKKHYAYGQPLDKLSLVEESGDLCWGINLLLRTIGVSWESVWLGNIAKLEVRYPGLVWTEEGAGDRDKEAEAIALAKALR